MVRYGIGHTVKIAQSLERLQRNQSLSQTARLRNFLLILWLELSYLTSSIWNHAGWDRFTEWATKKDLSGDKLIQSIKETYEWQK